MSRVLVTGATGFVGGNLMRYLVSEGFEVAYLARPGKNAPAAEGLDRALRVDGDVTDEASLDRAVAGCELVFHAAAFVSMLERDRREMERVNVGGTQALLRASARAGVQRFILVSSVDAIGVRDDGQPADETTPYNMDQFNNPYPTTKHAQELAALAAPNDVVVVNPSYMLGAYDPKPTSSRMVLEIMRGRGVLASKGGNSFVDVEDVARGTLLAARKGKRGERYILGGHNWTYLEMFTRIAGRVGRRPPLAAVPQPVAYAAAVAFEAWAWLSKGTPAVSRAEVSMAGVPHYFASAKAERELGYRFSPIEPAIDRARDWFLRMDKGLRPR